MSEVAAPPAEPAAPAAPVSATLIPNTPAAPVAAATPNWIGDDGAFGANWLEKLPEDMRGNPSLTVLKNLPDLAKSYVETKRLVGTKLEAPGENATPEQLTAWRKVVGAPETPEGYLGDAKTLRPDSVPEEFWDKENEGKFAALAHKHHLPPAAVKEIVGFHAEAVAAALKSSGEQEAVVLAGESVKLRTAWGQDFDSNLAMAGRVAQTVGLDPKTHPAFTSAEMVQAFAKMGKLLSEDKLVKGDNPSISATIGERARDITDSKSNSPLARDYRGEFGPERQAAAQKQLHELYAALQAA